MMDQAAGAASAFLSKNYVNRDVSDNAGIFTATTMQAILDRVLDMDPYSYWASGGSNDTITEIIELELFEGTTKASRVIDFIALMNINLKNFKLEYSNLGGAYAVVPGTDYSVANYAAGDLALSLAASITADKLKLTMTTTQNANEEKKVGNIIAALQDFQLARPFDKYDKKFKENVRTVTLGDGTEDTTYIKRSGASYEHYGASLIFREISAAQRDLLRRLKREGSAFLFYPEPGDVVRDMFLCQFSGAWADSYSNQFKGAGYDISFNLSEVGA